MTYMSITKTKEKVRDGFLGDLPPDLQTKVMNIHKLIKDTVRDILDDDNYEDLKKSSWAKSCIDEFCVMPKDKSEIGSIRVYKKGKTYRCMIQATGHFTNHQYGWIEELLHDFICNVYATVRPKIRKQYDMTITNEGRTGQPFEGFDIYPNPKVVRDIWDSLEGRKTKTITEGVEEIEVSSDLMNYYEFYSNIPYDSYFYEKSHGKLKYEFRLVVGETDGHLYKIIYELNPDNIKSDNIDTSEDTVNKLKKNIRSTGNINYTSQGNKVVAIVDMSTNKRVNTVSAYPPIHNIGGNIMPTTLSGYMKIMSIFIKDTDKLKEIEDNIKKEHPTGIIRNPAFESAIEESKKRGQNPIVYKVNSIDNNLTYKTTNINKILSGMLNIPKNHKYESYDYEHLMEASATPEYNVSMSERDAKKTLATLSQNIINDIANKKGYKVSQYTANIYANIITKNLLPLWAKGFRKFSITLDSYQSFCTFEFKVPSMTQDFVARFVNGRESLNGFIHRQSEIKVKMSPNIFHTMKDANDAYSFFKAAIKYYDSSLERYGNKMMVDVLKLNHEMKHLISTTKLSGIVVYPLSLLFKFDDVKMDDRDVFRITQEDVKTISQFMRSIYTRYADPNKERKRIVDDVQEMVKALREYSDIDDENMKSLTHFPEAVDMYLSGEFDKKIESAHESWILEHIDFSWNSSNPEVRYLQEKFGVKKLKKIPSDLVAYISIETEAIKDANDKMMISSYCLGKIEIVEWYIELLDVGSKKYIVPHTKPYLEGVRTQLLACFKKIMDTPIPKKDRPLIDIQYPKGYEG